MRAPQPMVGRMEQQKRLRDKRATRYERIGSRNNRESRESRDKRNDRIERLETREQQDTRETRESREGLRVPCPAVSGRRNEVWDTPTLPLVASARPSRHNWQGVLLFVRLVQHASEPPFAGPPGEEHLQGDAHGKAVAGGSVQLRGSPSQ